MNAPAEVWVVVDKDGRLSFIGTPKEVKSWAQEKVRQLDYAYKSVSPHRVVRYVRAEGDE